MQNANVSYCDAVLLLEREFSYFVALLLHLKLKPASAVLLCLLQWKDRDSEVNRTTTVHTDYT